MRKTEMCRSWVVYRMTLPKGGVGGNVVCTQREWDAIEAAHPGHHHLLHAGVGSEQEAEKLARGTAGDDARRAGKKVARIGPLFGPRTT
jgi:hypothetical protein